MDIQSLLERSRDIWGDEKLDAKGIVVRMGVMLGDISRYARNAPKDTAKHTDEELKKELGNFIFSSIRWCDDQGYDVEECINLAIDCQKRFQK